MSDMSSSEKPEFCLPNLRGSTTFCVARGVQLRSPVIDGKEAPTWLRGLRVFVGVHGRESGRPSPAASPPSASEPLEFTARPLHETMRYG